MNNDDSFQAIKLGNKPYCDIVMKGGVTSGVVYPLAIIELARKYRFKNIGGTSAGAIAAALAAAAEVGREKDGFEKLDGISKEIPDSLPDFFQATESAKPLLDALKAFLGDKPVTHKLLSAFIALAKGFRWTTIIILVTFLMFAIVATYQYSLIVSFTVLLLGLAVWVCFIGWQLFNLIKDELPKQGFGVCPGLTQKGNNKLAITDWVSKKLDYIAALEVIDGRQRPLTFKDLYGEDEKNPLVNLEVITSNLAEGTPYRIPFESQKFFFKESELRNLFPDYVVNWMVEKSITYTEYNGAEENDEDPYRYLPFSKDLPVIFAVRLSLSFPFLLSAVSLYARDFNLKDKIEQQIPRKCWFSDGGICSNFPVHLFDRVLPSWPTFAITLEKYDESHHGNDRVSLPQKAGEGILKNLRQDNSTFDFVSAIIDTMQEWQDNLQSSSPAYRHRIVRVRLEQEEGGLNLMMPHKTVQKLADYGKEAGEKLREDFKWDRHRWIRYVTALAGYGKSYRQLLSAWDFSSNFFPGYDEFVKEYGNSKTIPFPQVGAWKKSAKKFISDLKDDAKNPEHRSLDNSKTIPKPEISVRMMPQFWSASAHLGSDTSDKE